MKIKKFNEGLNEAKEKANELFEKFLNIETNCHISKFLAQECAIICVDEIINLDYFSIEGRCFWADVKKELEEMPI